VTSKKNTVNMMSCQKEVRDKHLQLWEEMKARETAVIWQWVIMKAI